MKHQNAYDRALKAITHMENEIEGSVSMSGKSFAEAVLRSCRHFAGEDALAVIHRQKDSARDILTIDESDTDVFAPGDSSDRWGFLDRKKIDCVERNDGSMVNGKYRTWVVVPVMARKESILSIVMARKKGRFHAAELQAVNFLGTFYTQILHGIRIRNKKVKTLSEDIRRGILLNIQSSITRNRVEWDGYAATVDYGAGIGSDAAKAYIQGDGDILLSTLDITADNTERQTGLIYLDAWLTILSQTSLDPAGMLNRINGDILRRKVECYASIALVRYMRNKEKVEIAGCGNISTLCFSHETMSAKAIDFGVAAGVAKELNIKSRDIPVKCGDIVCVFTDGVSGTRKRNGELFGSLAVGEIIEKHYYLSAEELATKIISAVRDKSENGVNLDDRTIQVLKIV